LAAFGTATTWTQGESVHIEILVEDLAGKKALDILVPKILGDEEFAFRVHAYRGIGRVPKNMRDAADASKRILLTNLPRLLKGYGRAFRGYSPAYRAAVVLVCDIDDRNPQVFLRELRSILAACNPKPEAHFCLAIEEGEAWFLGDLAAIKSAYPNAKSDVLNAYVNDSICGTWETLADAVYNGSAKALSRKGWQSVGAEKSRWADAISPRMDVKHNASPSFHSFRDKMRSL
jgi:hypothetical protein